MTTTPDRIRIGLFDLSAEFIQGLMRFRLEEGMTSWDFPIFGDKTTKLTAGILEELDIFVGSLKFDYIARRTDLASGNNRIGFALDDRFLHGGPHRVAIKITYHDVGIGRWQLIVPGSDGKSLRRAVECHNTGRVFTRTFMFQDAAFPAKGEAFDFVIEASGKDATIAFVRVVKR